MQLKIYFQILEKDTIYVELSKWVFSIIRLANILAISKKDNYFLKHNKII